MSYAIGIDVGVTNIKSVCVTERGEVLSRNSAPTFSDQPDWPNRVKTHIEELQRERGEAATWIGLAAPGLAAPDGSCISWMQGRLGEVQGLNWTRFLGRMNVPILNDAQAALMGEVWLGAAAGAKNAALLTLGTGVGGALMVDGRLLKGQIGRAGHLGHMCLNPDAPGDIVHTPGSLEDAIGNCTIGRRSNGRFTTTHELTAAYLAGDPYASEVWLKSVKALAAAIASIINIADPEVVIIGGGIAVAGPALFTPLEKWVNEFEWQPHGHRARLAPAKLGEYAGAFGAARNAML
jgi:glucokinase